MSDSSERAHRLSLAEGEIHYMKGGAGAPVVVLHHSIGNHGWLPFHERLAERFTVYVPDLPGFGESTRPAWARDPRDLAAQMHLALDRLGLERVGLVGLGFGGWVAAEMAAMNQGRLSRLTLVGAAGIQPRHGERPIADQLVIDYVDYVRMGFEDEAAFARHFGDDPPVATRSILYGAREMAFRLTWKPWMFRRGLPHLLADVQTPTLVAWGSKDRIIPLDAGRQYASALPNSDLLVIDGAGHFLEFERPEILADAIAGQVPVSA